MADVGAYRSGRAAALSGVPERTVHDWARKGIVVPRVSAERMKLWSYADLMALRIVSWLRKPKTARDGTVIDPCPMSRVKAALDKLDTRGLELWAEEEGSRILVQADGGIITRATGVHLDGDQVVEPGLLDLVGPFEHFDLRGPDLRRPRAHLRIVPSKLSGEPHVAGTRLESRAVAALVSRGLSAARIGQLYPFASAAALSECVDLEDQLSENLATAAA